MGKVNFSLGSNFSPCVIVLAILWIGWSQLQLAEAVFNRSCEGPICMFNQTTGPGEPRATQYLECTNNTCVCAENTKIADVPSWKLRWVRHGRHCYIDEYGPCGRDRNLDIGCNQGYECIENRCRDRRKLHRGKEGEFCYGKIDCRRDLVCKLSPMPVPWERTKCYKP